VIELDRFDESERLTLAFIGLEPSSDDWLGVVFGRGKLMGPPLTGAEITGEAIGTLLKELTQDCTCSKPLAAMGVDLPMHWNSRFDAVLPEPEAGEAADDVESAVLGESPPKAARTRPAPISSVVGSTILAFAILIAAVLVATLITVLRRR
jgi:hypothetical protein